MLGHNIYGTFGGSEQTEAQIGTSVDNEINPRVYNVEEIRKIIRKCFV